MKIAAGASHQIRKKEGGKQKGRESKVSKQVIKVLHHHHGFSRLLSKARAIDGTHLWHMPQYLMSI
jgi:hypothetical protein